MADSEGLLLGWPLLEPLLELPELLVALEL
jgi:hypothetical protein